MSLRLRYNISIKSGSKSTKRFREIPYPPTPFPASQGKGSKEGSKEWECRKS